MTNQKMIIVLTLIGLSTLAVLAYFATLGNVWAYALLFSAWSIGCICIGWYLCHMQYKSMTDTAQQNFIENAKENMALMDAVQKTQNRQNQTLMQQLGQATRLNKPNSGLLIDGNGLFDDLEGEN